MSATLTEGWHFHAHLAQKRRRNTYRDVRQDEISRWTGVGTPNPPGERKYGSRAQKGPATFGGDQSNVNNKPVLASNSRNMTRTGLVPADRSASQSRP